MPLILPQFLCGRAFDWPSRQKPIEIDKPALWKTKSLSQNSSGIFSKLRSISIKFNSILTIQINSMKWKRKTVPSPNGKRGHPPMGNRPPGIGIERPWFPVGEFELNQIELRLKLNEAWRSIGDTIRAPRQTNVKNPDFDPSGAKINNRPFDLALGLGQGTPRYRPKPPDMAGDDVEDTNFARKNRFWIFHLPPKWPSLLLDLALGLGQATPRYMPKPPDMAGDDFEDTNFVTKIIRFWIFHLASKWPSLLFELALGLGLGTIIYRPKPPNMAGIDFED